METKMCGLGVVKDEELKPRVISCLKNHHMEIILNEVLSDRRRLE